MTKNVRRKRFRQSRGFTLSRPALLLLCFLFCAGMLGAQTIRVNQQNTNLAKIATALQKQFSHMNFSYNPQAFEKVTIQQIDIEAKSLPELLELLKKKTGLHSLIDGSNITLKYFPLPTPAPKSATQQSSGEVRGRIIDEETGQPIQDVSIRIGNKGTTSRADGSFTFTLPKGTYEAEVSYVGYGKKLITDITVRAKQVFELNITLKREKGQLSAVVVQASARRETIASLYTRQKNNAAISDGISQEQIRRTPDNNVAQVLKRVSGLTIQDEKFVTVRGLSERYNTVLMNGAMLPSTEPNRRNFAFDIIPSGLIDNIVINKTATPDLSSEFAGGLVQVNTIDIPMENYMSITIGTGINTNSTGKQMHSSKRGKHEYLGFDDGTKGWWKKQDWNWREYYDARGRGDWQEVTRMGQQIPNNWGVYKYDYKPVQNYQLSIGHRFSLPNEAQIGITAGALYRHDENVETEERRTPSGDMYEYTGENYLFKSSLGALFNIAYKTRKHKIALKNLYNRLFINETTDYTGVMRAWGTDGPQRNYLFLNTINDLWQRRLEGEHEIGKKGIRFDWSGDWITVLRDQPDTRNSIGWMLQDRKDLYEYPAIRDRTSFLSRGLSIYNTRLEEKKYNWSANITLPFTIKGNRQKIRAGYTGSYRDAAFDGFGLSGVMQFGPDLAPDYENRAIGLPDYKLLGNEMLEPGYNFYEVVNMPGTSYEGYQRLHAGYLMADLLFFRKLRLTGGVRAEDNTMFVDSEFYIRGQRYSDITYKKTHWLPSANLVYALTSKMNVRASVSQTLSRPDFRERAGFVYYDFKSRNEYSGAMGLKDATITNYDLRYEFYPAASEVLSFSLFYKHFDAPVELIAAQGSGGLRYFYFNLNSSESKGIEIDFRKSLGFIDPASKILRNIFLSGNSTWMKGNIKYDANAMLSYANEITQGIETETAGDERSRPLQGLSSNIYNAGISFTGKPVGIQISYNRFGKRIITGGLYPFQDEYENPRDVIDIQLNASLLKNKLVLRFNIADLLQQPVVVYNNFNPKGQSGGRKDINPNNDPRGTSYNPDLDYTRYKSKRGINLSLNATYNF